MRKMLISAVALSITAACSHAAPNDAASAIALSDARVQLPAVPGRPAAAYFTLSVPGNASGTLVAVSAEHFARSELHHSSMANGAMAMELVDNLPLKPGQPVVFAPGGYHVMLFDGDGTLKPGATTRLTARLSDGKTVSTMAKVSAAGGDAM